MVGKKLKLLCAHFLAVATILVVTCGLFPDTAFCLYTRTANIILFLIIAYITFNISKRWFLNDRIIPEDKAVLITGCDTGLGNQLAKRLDTLGFHVFASCLFPGGVGAQELKDCCSDRLQILYLDVTKDESAQKAVNFVKEKLGSKVLWAVVNNAGILKNFTIELTTQREFEDTMVVNTFGVVRVTKAFLPLIKKSKGRIVNVTSNSGRIPINFLAAYSMSKHAAVAFTECLSQEISVWGVRAISIEPEIFRSPLSEEKNMAHLIDKSLSQLETDILDDYGEEYFKEMKKSLIFISQKFAIDISIVINDIESAITLKYPDHAYKPRRNIITRFYYDACQYMPFELVETVFLFVTRIIGIPIPKKCKYQSKDSRSLL